MKRIIIIMVLISALAVNCMAQKANINATGKDIKGNGNIVKKEISVSGFNKLDVMSLLQIQLIQSNSEKVVIKTDENIIEYIDVCVKNGKLIVKFKDECKSIKNYKSLDIFVYFKDLSEIKAMGVAEIKSGDDMLQFNDLFFNICGASFVEMLIKCEKLVVRESGSSRIVLSGNVSTADINCTGASNLYAKDLLMENCRAIVSGASEATVNVKNTLEIETRNASSLKYYGNPAITDISEKNNSVIIKQE